MSDHAHVCIIDVVLHPSHGDLRLFELLIHILFQIFGLLSDFGVYFLLGLLNGVLRCLCDFFLEEMLGQREIDKLHPMWLDLLVEGYFGSRLVDRLRFAVENLVEFFHKLLIVRTVDDLTQFIWLSLRQMLLVHLKLAL